MNILIKTRKKTKVARTQPLRDSRPGGNPCLAAHLVAIGGSRPRAIRARFAHCFNHSPTVRRPTSTRVSKNVHTNSTHTRTSDTHYMPTRSRHALVFAFVFCLRRRRLDERTERSPARARLAALPPPASRQRRAHPRPAPRAR
ncbi:hypothetical protein Zmor_021090 [Zophobas morio]|uniref:Uncharacterized protein n=1 Tax=Zophobas morio TaxID=2755281 RepID=A0AA38MA92_9CUCU|nr:hypothetical protein Zmor_024519 [Zophobas morio]KAJ3649340.1 hypothetical protein Zmor_021090 [Zophobas morio]